MSRKPTPAPPDPIEIHAAKGAAHEAIGKLLGDDAEIRKGRAKQKRAANAAARNPSTEQE